MMSLGKGARAALVTTVAVLIAGTASAQPTNAQPTGAQRQASAAKTPCFFVNQWEGWKAPNDHTLYLEVNRKAIYQVDLAGRSALLQEADARLVNRSQGPDTVCYPLDLQLAVSTFAGISEPLIPTRITKLTPEQVAAIPKPYRPD